MAVTKIPGVVFHYPYAQTSITPITAGNSKLTPFKKATAYAQSTITPVSGGSRVRPIPPLPGVALSGGSYGFPT
jgi:hypothetical protein